jgi:hypothetical protein
MAEIKEKSKFGKTLFYIDGNQVKEKSKFGNVKYYIDGSLTRDQLYSLIAII